VSLKTAKSFAICLLALACYASTASSSPRDEADSRSCLPDLQFALLNAALPEVQTPFALGFAELPQAAGLQDGSGTGREASGESNGAFPLTAPPAALLLVIQGLAFVSFVKTRRKWTVVVLLAVSLGKAGLESLPRLWSQKSRPVVPSVLTGTPAPGDLGQRIASEARTAARDYVWLLRGAAGQPNTAGKLLQQSVLLAPANGHATLSVAHPAAILSVDISAASHYLSVAFITIWKRPNSPSVFFAFDTLFARPPPTA